MTTYLIKYQISRKEGVGTPQGDWLDTKRIVLANEDAAEAWRAITDTLGEDYDFRLKGIEIVGQVDIIASEVMDGRPLE